VASDSSTNGRTESNRNWIHENTNAICAYALGACFVVWLHRRWRVASEASVGLVSLAMLLLWAVSSYLMRWSIAAWFV
jgi:hypothetical protein